MIKPSDLRIGVTINEKQWPSGDIKEITLNADDLSRICDGPTFDECYGIILTEEWHLKFGAKEVNNKIFTYALGSGAAFILNHDIVKQCWWVQYRNHGHDLSMPIEMKYVHELQNFYRFNTGKELIVKNDKSKTHRTIRVRL